MLSVEYLELRGPKRAVVWGDAPKDIIADGFKPGGPGYYIARVYEKLGVNVTLVSYIGEDYPRELLPKVRLIPEAPIVGKSMVYDNIYTSDGRIQFAHLNDCAKFPTYPDIMRSGLGLLIYNQNLLFITPLRRVEPNVVREICINFRESMRIGLIQGWCRHIAEDGKVSKRNKEEVAQDIERMKNVFDVIVFSNEDIDDALNWGRIWSAVREGEEEPVIVVTENVNGCTVFKNGVQTHVPAYQIEKIIDPTGAGDRFAAFFAFMYRITDNWRVSAQFANAATAYALHNGNEELQLEKIFEFAGNL